MSDFSIVDGVAEIHDSELYRTWLDRPDYIAALAASPDPGTAATKHVVIEFHAEQGRMIRDRAVEERIRDIMERYVAEDYVQHDPNAPGNGRELLIEFLRHVPLDGGAAPSGGRRHRRRRTRLRDHAATPPRTRVIPSGTYDWYILSVYRVRDGKLSEHWGALRKLAPRPAPM